MVRQGCVFLLASSLAAPQLVRKHLGKRWGILHRMERKLYKMRNRKYKTRNGSI